MNTPLYPKTFAFATLLFNPHQRNEQDVQEAIEKLFSSCADEVKSDLYARVVETVTRDDTFTVLMEKVNKCIGGTLEVYPHG